MTVNAPLTTITSTQVNLIECAIHFDGINNILFCSLAGVLWYSQFFGLEMGKSYLTEYPIIIAFSWSILMSLNVLFSNFWGVILKAWKGCNSKTIALLIKGLVILVISIFFPSLF